MCCTDIKLPAAPIIANKPTSSPAALVAALDRGSSSCSAWLTWWPSSPSSTLRVSNSCSRSKVTPGSSCSVFFGSNRCVVEEIETYSNGSRQLGRYVWECTPACQCVRPVESLHYLPSPHSTHVLDVRVFNARAGSVYMERQRLDQRHHRQDRWQVSLPGIDVASKWSMLTSFYRLHLCESDEVGFRRRLWCRLPITK